MEKLTSKLNEQLRKGEISVDQLTSQLQEREQTRNFTLFVVCRLSFVVVVDSSVNQVTLVKSNIEENLSLREQNVSEMSRKNSELLNEISNLKLTHLTQMEEQRLRLSQTTSQLNATEAMLRNSQADNAQLQSKVIAQGMEIDTLNAKIRELTALLEKANSDISNRDSTIANLNVNLDNAREEIESLEAKRREDEIVRRKLHNTIQELKGNIRVFCRIRPMLGKEGANEAVPLELIGVERKAFELTAPNVLSLALTCSFR
jgi:kinesin family protein C1